MQMAISKSHRSFAGAARAVYQFIYVRDWHCSQKGNENSMALTRGNGDFSMTKTFVFLFFET